MTEMTKAERDLRDAAVRAYMSMVGPAEIVAQVLTEVRVAVRRDGGDVGAFLDRVQEDVEAARRIEQQTSLRMEGFLMPRDPSNDTEGEQ